MPAKPKPVRQASTAKSAKGALTRPETDRKKRQDALLDDGLRETFPASDPVSIVEVK